MTEKAGALKLSQEDADLLEPPPTGSVKQEDGDNEIIDDETVIERLAGMPLLDYERVREAEAKSLGVRVLPLDKLVELTRRQRDNQESPADTFEVSDPEPWPEHVDGATLLNDLAEAIAKYLVLPAGASDALALWILHAHAHDTASISPILAVTSPTPECGKTTLLTLLSALVPKPLPASNITTAALFRSVEKWRPTMLVDEADTFLKGSDELRGIINSGHSKASAFVIRTVGDNHEPMMFSTWAPKAIAMIGKLPDTLASRAIHIELRRIADGEVAERLRGDRLEQFEPLRQRAWRWAQDNRMRLRTDDPDLPAFLRGRAADNWRHLIAIADLAGGDWPDRARQAARRLNAGCSEQTAGVMLLEDIKALFDEQKSDRLPTAKIVEVLGRLDDRPWSEWRNGKPITARQLAKLLEPFKITPASIRAGSETAKGYRRVQFDDAFRRYLSSQSGTPSQVNELNDSSTIPSVTTRADVTDSMLEKAAELGHCDGVTDEDTLASGEGDTETATEPLRHRRVVI